MTSTSSPHATVASPDPPHPVTTAATPSTFTFPPQYSFPPFFDLQPVQTTRASQLATWSALVQSYCRHHRLFALSPVDAADSPLFRNRGLGRGLGARAVRAVIEYMASREGGGRAEWVGAGKAGGGGEGGGEVGGEGEGGGKAWIYWRRPEEWAEVVESWVDATAQKNTVLTLYELVASDATRGQEFHGMEPELMLKSLQVLVKRGAAQVFGADDSLGVKFF